MSIFMDKDYSTSCLGKWEGAVQTVKNSLEQMVGKITSAECLEKAKCIAAVVSGVVGALLAKVGASLMFTNVMTSFAIGLGLVALGSILIAVSFIILLEASRSCNLKKSAAQVEEVQGKETVETESVSTESTKESDKPESKEYVEVVASAGDELPSEARVDDTRVDDSKVDESEAGGLLETPFGVGERRTFYDMLQKSLSTQGTKQTVTSASQQGGSSDEIDAVAPEGGRGEKISIILGVDDSGSESEK